MKKQDLKPAIDALLLVSESFLSIDEIAKLTKQKEDVIEKTIEEMIKLYKTKEFGFEIRKSKDGYKLFTKPEFSDILSNFKGINNEITLSPQAVETLSIVAYKQPVSKLEIQDIRGVNSDGVINTLLIRGLVKKAFENLETGAAMFELAPYAYELLGISSKDDLEPISPFVPENLDQLGFTNEFEDIRKKPRKKKEKEDEQ